MPTARSRRARLALAAALASGSVAVATVAVPVAASAQAPANTRGATAGQPETAPHIMYARNAARPKSGGTNQLAYQSSFGRVVKSLPKVYVVYWGSQWQTGGNGDPYGIAALQTSFLNSLTGSGDTWSTSTMQYCDGVSVGTIICLSGQVPHPASGTAVVAGTWIDNTTAPPQGATQSNIAAEVARAVAHFAGQNLRATGDGVQYVVDFPSGIWPQGFAAKSGGNYCAWHSSTSVNGTQVAYTNFPYIPDAGASCGAGFVGSSAVNPATQGVTIVGGHEYAETLTDQYPGSGIAWEDRNGQENGDKCAWITAGNPGASAVVGFSGTQYAVQSLWSNNFNGNKGGCVISYSSPTSQSQ